MLKNEVMLLLLLLFYYIYYNNNAIPTQEKSALQFEKHALCSLCILEEAQWSGGFL